MNILPLVTALLCILAIASHTLMQEKISSFWEKKAFLGSLDAERTLRNKIEQKRYRHSAKPAKKELKPGETPKKSKEKPRVSIAWRENSQTSLLSRLNIASLFEPNSSDSSRKLYHTAATLFDSLYAHTPFYKEAKEKMPDLETRLLDALIASARACKGFADLNEITLADPMLHAVFYKMCRGTNQYNLASHTGFPPLTDFFIADTNKKALYFRFASPILLQAFFGETVATEILKQERKKSEEKGLASSLSKQELQLLTSKNPELALKFEAFQDLFSYTNRSPPATTITHTDPSSGITTKK